MKSFHEMIGAVIFLCVVTTTFTIRSYMASISQRLQVPEDEVKFVLDVNHPEEFLKTHLPKALLEPPSGELSVQAIQNLNTVRIKNEDKAIDMNVILIDGSNSGKNADSRISGLIYIQLTGDAVNLEEAYQLAKAICHTVGIDDTKIRSWYDNKGYENKLVDTCLQTGKTRDTRVHEISIRHSRNPDGTIPWRVDYALNTKNQPRQSIDGPK